MRTQEFTHGAWHNDPAVHWLESEAIHGDVRRMDDFSVVRHDNEGLFRVKTEPHKSHCTLCSGRAHPEANPDRTGDRHMSGRPYFRPYDHYRNLADDPSGGGPIR